MATFQAKCSNDYRYYDEYQTIDPYWKDVSDCGEEGTVKYFYDSIDVMATSMFLYNNKIPISIDPMAHYATIELGTVFEIGFKSQKDTNCVTIRARSNYGEQELLEKAIEP